MEALLLPILLIAVFYFLLIRPQQRQRKQMQEMQQTLAVGSQVMTGAGLLATVVAVDDDEVLLEVAPGVTNRYVRRAVVNVISSPDTGEVPAEENLDNLDDASASASIDEPNTVDTPAEDRANGESR